MEEADLCDVLDQFYIVFQPRRQRDIALPVVVLVELHARCRAIVKPDSRAGDKEAVRNPQYVFFGQLLPVMTLAVWALAFLFDPMLPRVNPQSLVYKAIRAKEELSSVIGHFKFFEFAQT